MENKKKKEIILNDTFPILVSLFIFGYYFYGFIIDENSAGAGPYDFELIWSNLQLFKENIFNNLDSQIYNDSRPPLSYILHVLFNTFTDNKENFRTTVFLISFLVPILFFFSIKKKFNNLNNSLLLLLTSIITLSPYFRTTAYWGLGENYGFICILLTFLFFESIKNTKLKYYFFSKNILFFLPLCFFSSLCIYFDQKLIFVPAYCYYFILEAKIDFKYKILTTIYYFIFALPFLYLIFLWGGIMPPTATDARSFGIMQLHPFHLGYCLSMIAFYVFPLIFFTNFKIENFRKNIFSEKFFYLSIIFIVYLIVLIFFGNFNDLPSIGKGIVHKFLELVFENTNIKLLFTLIAFFISGIIILEYFKYKIELIFVIYFLFLSIFTFPFQQEYLDPLIFLLAFSFFNTKLNITVKTTYAVVFYFLIFSISSNIYYTQTIN
tara:strand:+ start:1789 stop:3096 length:1308 start_codon:yes stop_codon:yes gene_type:complete